MEGEYFTYTYPTTGDMITFCRADMEAEVRAGGMELPEWLLWHNGLTANIPMN